MRGLGWALVGVASGDEVGVGLRQGCGMNEGIEVFRGVDEADGDSE